MLFTTVWQADVYYSDHSGARGRGEEEEEEG